MRGSFAYVVVALAGCEKCDPSLEVQMPAVVGVGLEHAVEGYYCDKVTCTPAEGMVVTSQTAGVVDLQVGGATLDDVGQPLAMPVTASSWVRILPLTAGPNVLEFDGEPHAYDAVPIDEVVWSVGGSERNAITTFAQGQFSVVPKLKSGEYEMGGRAAVEITAPPNAVSYLPANDLPGSSSGYKFGAAPFQAVFRSAVAPQTLTVDVVGIGGIMAMQLRAGATIDVSQPLLVSSSTNIVATPLDGRGEPILGDPDAGGTAQVVGGTVDATWITTRLIAIVPRAPGDSTVQLTWGSASVSFVVRVVQ